MQVSEGVLGTNFFKMGPEVKKKQDAKNYCNTKMPQHFHRLLSVLKIELNLILFLKLSFDVFECEKILEHIFCKFYM